MTSSLVRYTQTLEKSRLIEPDALARQLAEFEARRAARRTNDEVSAFALALVTAGLLTPWQQEKLTGGHSKGFFLGQYKLLGLLGVGAMGAVYLAEHVKMLRRVAIKVLPAKFVKDVGNLKRFYREARAIAALDHPNIIQAYSLDNEGELHYLVMQYVEGQDLEQIVNQSGPLAAERAAQFIRQAADGLGHAHARGIIHRDVKPSNLLVDGADNVRVLDLGLARMVSAESASDTGSEEQHQNVVGTMDYLAPEQALNSRDIDGRADIYSLGCTLYFLLTGRPPFPGKTLAEKLVRHQMERPPEITSLRADVPADLAAVCARMMKKKPDDRYPSADAVSEALAQLYPSESGEPSASNGARPTAEASFGMGFLDPAVAIPDFTHANTPSPAGGGFWEQDRAWKLVCVAGAAVVIVFALVIWGVTRGTNVALQGKSVETPAKRAQFVPDEAESLWPGSQDTKGAKRNKGKKKQDPVDPDPPKTAPPIESAPSDPPKLEPAAVRAVVDLSRKQSVFTRADEASQYTLLYHLTIPDDANFNQREVPYTVDNRPEIRGPIDRVAYCLELQTRGARQVDFVFVSFLAPTQDLNQLGVPNVAAKVRVQAAIRDLNIVSNVAGVTTGTGIKGGLEFCETTYSPVNRANAPGASDETLDFGDTFSNRGSCGSMQIHNWEARQTVLAYNSWGSGAGEAGIGNAPSGHPDWTFTKNIRSYTLKDLYVLVRLKDPPGK